MRILKNGIMLFPLIVWGVLCSSFAIAIDIEDSPESVTLDSMMNLYQEVIFDHQMHTEMYDCNACHHHTAGTGPASTACSKCHSQSTVAEDVSCSGCHLVDQSSSAVIQKRLESLKYHIDKPGLKGALHLQCLGCHSSEGGPVGCQECHTFTPAGSKRFSLKK